MTEEGAGPFVGVAAFCEYVLDEKDDVLSAIRIIDRVILTLTAEVKEGDATAPYFFWYLIKFTSRGVSEERTLLVKIKNPVGEESVIAETPVMFQADKTGVNFRIKLGLGFRRQGCYWFLVYLDNTLMTQTPLVVEFHIEASESSDSQTIGQPES